MRYFFWDQNDKNILVIARQWNCRGNLIRSPLAVYRIPPKAKSHHVSSSDFSKNEINCIENHLHHNTCQPQAGEHSAARRETERVSIAKSQLPNQNSYISIRSSQNRNSQIRICRDLSTTSRDDIVLQNIKVQDLYS